MKTDSNSSNSNGHNGHKTPTPTPKKGKKWYEKKKPSLWDALDEERDDMIENGVPPLTPEVVVGISAMLGLGAALMLLVISPGWPTLFLLLGVLGLFMFLSLVVKSK